MPRDDYLEIEQVLISTFPSAVWGNFPKQTAEFACKDYIDLLEEYGRLQLKLDRLQQGVTLMPEEIEKLGGYRYVANKLYPDA